MKRDIYRDAKCGRGSSLRKLQCGTKLCSTMLARHDERWNESVRQQASRNVAEGRSNEEDPFGRRGAKDNDEDDPFGQGGIVFCGERSVENVCASTADKTLRSDSKTCLR